MSDTLSVVILAAGRGTRMRNGLAKVLHPIGGLPMLGHVLRMAADLDAATIVVVLAPNMEDVAASVRKLMPGVRVAIQERPTGTGGAVQAATALLPESGSILVLYGDTPLMSGETSKALVAALRERQAAVSVFGMSPPDRRGYGRLKMNGQALEAIVEERHADDILKRDGLCNAGAMAFDGARLRALLDAMPWRADKEELYLTDCVHLACMRGWSCTAIEAPWEDGVGVNSQSQLAAAEHIFQERQRRLLQDKGVIITAPETLFVSADVHIEPGARIEPYVVLRGKVAIGRDATILGFSHIEGASIAAGAIIGPFARLRPGTAIGEDAHVGNFVEFKNASLGQGAKANHLAYLGDAAIDAGANIGAGTITANYDGFHKHRTEIGQGAFIGSNSVLVAPVAIGKESIVGAGSVITSDVPPSSLALARGRQAIFPERAPELRAAAKQRAAELKAKAARNES